MLEIIGFKGFDKNLKCRDFQYEVGRDYLMPSDSVKICSSGFHFSEKLIQTMNFYGKHSNNRYCLVKGFIPDDKINNWRQSDKVVTHNLKIIKELTKEDVELIIKEEKTSNKLTLDEIFRIDEIKTIQTAYPEFILGGSSALYLLGFNIKRTNQVSDLDFCVPYFKRLDLKDFKVEDNVTEVDQMDDCKNSGNDFDYTNAIVIDGDFILMDMKIDPKQKYFIVNYQGFDFKVSDWKIIIEAKMRYMYGANGKKHKDDILNMFGNPVSLKDKTEKEVSYKEQFIKDNLSFVPVPLKEVKDPLDNLF